MTNLATVMKFNSYRLEKGIPLPGTHGNQTYPLQDMEVGDSFAFPPEKYGSLRQTAHARGAKLGMEFKIMKRGNECRCWRVA